MVLGTKTVHILQIHVIDRRVAWCIPRWIGSTMVIANERKASIGD